MRHGAHELSLHISINGTHSTAMAGLDARRRLQDAREAAKFPGSRNSAARRTNYSNPRRGSRFGRCGLHTCKYLQLRRILMHTLGVPLGVCSLTPSRASQSEQEGGGRSIAVTLPASRLAFCNSSKENGTMANPRLSRVARTVLGIATLALILFVRPASAGSVSITSSASTSLTLTEGGSAIIVDFTFTNNTGAALVSTLFQGGFGVVSGDISDNTGFSFLPSSCNGLTSLGAGSSCTLSLSFSSPFFTIGGETETPTDSGITPMRVGLTYLCPNCPGDTDPTVIIGGQSYFAPFFKFSATANDASATPEPSSLLLLGTGLLGLGPFLRRRFVSASADSE